MLFENLRDKLDSVFKKLRSKGRLDENDIKTAMREVRLALLEADVNFKVVKDFTQRVSERANGAEVLQSLTPAQQVIKIVNDELVALMGKANEKIGFSPAGLTVIMLAGLQGTGKTTACAKLGLHLKKQGKKVMLAACDAYRPAAVDQLKTLGIKAGIDVYSEPEGTNPVSTAENALKRAVKELYDILIVDTAGRLHIDEDMMTELVRIKNKIAPHEILLAVDAMSGQSAAESAIAFNDSIGIDGIILTKLDSDARGGSALSVRAVTGKPIKFVGVGEKTDDFEPFHPDRIASRILGMGDMLSLIEKAQESFDQNKAKALEEKLRKESFTLDDFGEQIEQMSSMGSAQQLMELIPGMNKKMLNNAQIDQNAMKHTLAIIKSMTPKERSKPELLNFSRKQRIAKGSGTTLQEINALLKQFDAIKKMFKQFSKNKMPKNLKGFFSKF